MDWIELLSILVPTLVVIAGLFWGGWAAISKKISSVSMESGELFTAVGVAFKDSNLTGDEIRTIIKEGGDVVDAIRAETIKRSTK